MVVQLILVLIVLAFLIAALRIFAPMLSLPPPVVQLLYLLFGFLALMYVLHVMGIGLPGMGGGGGGGAGAGAGGVGGGGGGL